MPSRRGSFELLTKLATASLLLLALLHAGILFMPGPYKSLDFATFYRAGLLTRHGQLTSIYNKDVQTSISLPFVEEKVIGYFYHPVFEAPLFALFALLPFSSALLLWRLVSIVLVGIAGWLLKREFRGLQPHPTLIAFGFFPVLVLLWFGQDSAWLLLLLILAYRSFVRGQDWPCAMFLAFALFKFQYAIPLIVLLSLRRGWKFLLPIGVSSAALIVVSWLMIGVSGFLAYWRILHDHRYENSTRMLNIRGLFDIAGGHPFATVAVSLVLVLWFGLKSEAPDGLYFSGAVAIAVLVSYHGHTYDGVLLLLPVVAAFSQGLRWPALFFVTPVYLFFATCGVIALISLPIGFLAWQLSNARNLDSLGDGVV